MNADASAFDVNGARPSAVYDDGNTLIISFSSANGLLPSFGATLDVNRDDVNASCTLPLEANTVVVGLPNDYRLYTPGWHAIVIPNEINRAFSYTSDAFDEFNVSLYVDGNHWEIGNPLSDDYYVLRTYVGYTDHNVVVPFRYVSATPSFCPSNVSRVQLTAGWSLLPVYCLNGASSCSEYNSSLYYLSFVEFNSASGYVLQRPLYAAIAPWNAFGSAPTPVYSFDAAPEVNDLSAYWVWINPNWVQGGMSAYYYGRCLNTPPAPSSP